jgi:uncharacterized membrane protein
MKITSKKRRQLVVAAIIFVVTIIAMMNVPFAKGLFVVYCVLGVYHVGYFAGAYEWKITYVKGRKPSPIEIVATRK